MIVWVVARKDLLLIARDRAALLFLVLVPIVVLTVIVESLQGTDGGSLYLPVVNHDKGPVAELLIEVLDRHAEVVRVERDEAEKLVGRDKRAAVALVVPRGTSKRYLADKPTTLTLFTDPAKGTEINAAKAFLMLADKEAAALADPFQEELLALEEINLTGTRRSIPPPEQHIPGFGTMFVLMGVLFGVAFGLRDEEDAGSITRVRIAPISRASFFGGKLLARFVVGWAQFGLLFAFGTLVFDLALGPSIPLLALMLAAIVFSMTGFSLLVAAFARTREQVIPLGLTVVMIVCAVGGCWWPLYQAPGWLQDVARLTLTAWATEGIHDLILRERGFVDVLPTLGALVAYGLVGAALGLRLYRAPD